MSEQRGWLISVCSKRSNAAQPASKLYAARIADPEAAISAVRKYANASEGHLEIVVETTVSQLRAIKVPDGKVRRIRPSSRHAAR